MIRMMAGPRMTMKSDGKMHPTSGNSILIGAFAACSSARWRRSMRSCSDWTWRTFEIDTPSCSAWMIAPMKFVSGADLGSRDDVAQRLAARLADADLGQRPAELFGQRPLELLHDLAERGIEAETGPDGDRQQVEGVRDLQQDRVLALANPPAEPELGDRVAEQEADDAHPEVERDRQLHEADDDEQQDEDDRADDGRDGLDAEPVGDPQVARVAGEREAFLGLLLERAAGHARDAAGQRGGERPQGALEERLLKLELFEVLRLHRARAG